MNEARRGRWLPLVYYYLATLVGLVVLLVGVISGLHGLVQVALPQASGEVRFAVQQRPLNPEGPPQELSEEEKAQIRAEAIESVRLGGLFQALRGLVTALVGTPVFLWHLRQARRREPEWLGGSPPAPAT